MLKRLKQTMASDPCSLQEFCSDPHAVAGACSLEPREEGFPPRIPSSQLPGALPPVVVWLKAW